MWEALILQVHCPCRDTHILSAFGGETQQNAQIPPACEATALLNIPNSLQRLHYMYSEVDRHGCGRWEF